MLPLDSWAGDAAGARGPLPGRRVRQGPTPVFHSRSEVPGHGPDRGRTVGPQQGFDDIPSMFDDVFHDTPWHIAEQRDEALAEAREYLGHDPK